VNLLVFSDGIAILSAPGWAANHDDGKDLGQIGPAISPTFCWWTEIRGQREDPAGCGQAARHHEDGQFHKQPDIAGAAQPPGRLPVRASCLAGARASRPLIVIVSTMRCGLGG